MNQDRIIALDILNSDVRWTILTGRVYLIGIRMNLSQEQINDYLFESYENIGVEEISSSVSEIMKDMKLYFESIN